MFPKKLEPIKQKPESLIDQSRKNPYQHQSEHWKTRKRFQTILSQTW